MDSRGYRMALEEADARLQAVREAAERAETLLARGKAEAIAKVESLIRERDALGAVLAETVAVVGRCHDCIARHTDKTLLPRIEAALEGRDA